MQYQEQVEINEAGSQHQDAEEILMLEQLNRDREIEK
jgi:hypothetical protein